MAGRIPWRFYDPIEDETWFLPINPKEDQGSNAISKTNKYEISTSNYTDNSNELRVGDVVIMAGPDEQEKLSYSGDILTKEQYDLFNYWFSKEDPWHLRDDLGREWSIIIESYDTPRVRSGKFRYRHRYTFTAIVLERLE